MIVMRERVLGVVTGRTDEGIDRDLFVQTCRGRVTLMPANGQGPVAPAYKFDPVTAMRLGKMLQEAATDLLGASDDVG